MKEREEAIKRDKGRCKRCGQKFNEVHHIKPKYRGGSDYQDNQDCLCNICHMMSPEGKAYHKFMMNPLPIQSMLVPRILDIFTNRLKKVIRDRNLMREIKLEQGTFISLMYLEMLKINPESYYWQQLRKRIDFEIYNSEEVAESFREVFSDANVCRIY